MRRIHLVSVIALLLITPILAYSQAQIGNAQSAPPQPESRNESQPAAEIAAGEDQPTIARDSIQVKAFTFGVYRKNYDVWSWVPKIEYRVNGPIDSGSQLYVEFNVPAVGQWLKFDCQTDSVQKGSWSQTECGGRQISEDKGITYTGPVSFAIHLRNELAGGDITLFTGKMKVGKVHSNEEGPKAANKFVYYVDHDWNLPIAYLFYERDDSWDRDDPRSWAKPKFNFAFWTRGDWSGFPEPHIFHGGKEVGKVYYNGAEVSKPGCGTQEVMIDTNQSTAAGVPKLIWSRWKCTFYSVLPWDKTGSKDQRLFGPPYLFSENPGDYEIKIIHQGRLIRSFKFAVDAEGKIVDNGIAIANKLGSDRVIVPVQVIGDSDGPWDRNAWKTDAFYGNPLAGFNLP